MLFSTSALQTAALASMPARQRVVKASVGAGQEPHALQGRVGHHRHHDVELELAAGGPAEGDGLVVAQHPRGGLHQAFAHHRVDLAGHDGTARLEIGKLEFVNAALRPGAEPADVVGHVEERGGDGAQLPWHSTSPSRWALASK